MDIKDKYPRLELCPKCKRHGIILLSKTSKSIGFMTKQTGFAIINTYKEDGWINDEQYNKLQQTVNESDLADTNDPHTAWDEVIMMRLVWIYTKTQEGARLVEPYYACKEADPKLIGGTPEVIAKASLN